MDEKDNVKWLEKSIGGKPVYIILLYILIIIPIAVLILIGCGIIGKYEVSGGYELFRDILTIILAIAGLTIAILGYGIYAWIGNKLESRLKETLQTEQQELQKLQEEIKENQILFGMRLQRNLGYLFWQLYEVEKKKGKNKSTLVSKELIKFAIKRAKESLDLAKKLPESKYKDEVYKCKSNWVYFLAEAAVEDCELTMQVKEQALLISSEILEEISKQDYPNYYQYHESCAWALQHLSEAEDEFLKQKASNIIRELLKNLSIPFSWRETIEKKWVDLL